MNIPEMVKSLNLPEGSYVIVGSGILHMHDLRQTNDIDLVVTQEVFEELKQRGWKTDKHDNGAEYLTHDPFDVSTFWDFGHSQPGVEELLPHSTAIDGIPFLTLGAVLDWKRITGRPKDLEDIKLIEKHLELARS